MASLMPVKGWSLSAGETAIGSNDDYLLPSTSSLSMRGARAVIHFLALPPSTRFLVAGDGGDVWTDETLS